MYHKRLLQYLFSGLVVISITSCEKDEQQTSFPKPQLAAELADNGKDSTTVGASLVLHPKLGNVTDAGYSWTVNGTKMGADSVFTFKPVAAGDYKIRLRAVTKGGEVNLNYQIHVWAKYENGFYIVNEGWFGHGSGTVSFYRYDTQAMEDSLFVKENPGKDLGSVASTLQSGVIFNKKLFLVVKAGGPVVVTDQYSLKEQSRIPATAGSYWLSFVGIDANKGLLSSTTGLYPLDLNTLAIGTKITGLSGQTGDLIKQGNYIFALSQTDGVVILNASDLTVVKKIAGASVGFARTTDGAIWAAGTTKIFKISAVTLEVETTTVPFTIFGSWGAWHPGSISASTKENAIYFARSGSFGGGTMIYKYIPGNAASLQAPFATLPAGKIFYGAGVSYNAALNRLLVTTVQSGFGDNYKVNNLYFYDSVTADIKKTVTYDGFYFPSVIVSHQ